MAKLKDLGDLSERLDLLERKVSIIEMKIDESKRFAFDEIRQILMRLMSLEDSMRKVELKIQSVR